MTLCNTCRRIEMPGHACPPLWEIQADGQVETVLAYSASGAAEEWARQYDDADWFVLDTPGSPIVVNVRQPGEQEWQSFTITVEAVPRYRAEPC